MPTDSINPKPVSWVSVAAVFAGFALFLLLVYLARQPERPVQVELAKIPEEDRWKYTNEGRGQRLADLRAHEQQQATTYAWIDRPHGVVQLPIDRAMALTVQEINAARNK
jgi:hypothetical protein